MKRLKLASYIAHRGASMEAPENTLAAFELAARQGAAWVEFDVRLSKDLELVVIHDATTQRTTGVKGRVNQLTLTQLQRLDAGSWFSDAFSGQRIPTLLQVFRCAKEYSLNMNIEIKSPAAMSTVMARELIALLKKSGFFSQGAPKILISSKLIKNLQAMFLVNDTIPLAYVMDRWSLKWKALQKQIPLYSVHMKQQSLTQARVRELCKHGLNVLAYTVNDPARAKELFQWGVLSVFSDCILEG